ncbi:ygeA [Symbiodinium necroappetens]|uniref:YgeA protein n=1 Tax=Symbiodinium necroappetens TaxID=1628268 RepID=A0A812J134_9DINO|nr:ygeA [Symbiodinium necroappetens]
MGNYYYPWIDACRVLQLLGSVMLRSKSPGLSALLPLLAVAGLSFLGSSWSFTMQTIGMLTGVSYVSGIDYYRGINERIAKLLPNGHIMAKNSDMVIVSVDCDEYVRLLTAKDSEGVQDYLANGVAKLHRAGVDFLVIASNTAHICVGLVRERFPDLPVLHIADCTAAAARGAGPVGLLGTEPTMRDGSWLKERLALHGVEVVVPPAEEDRQRCYKIICDELSFDKFTDESRRFFAEMARKLHGEWGGSGGVILGCTEIELLLRPGDVPEVPLFRSAELHMDAAARVQAGQVSLESFMPSEKAAPA